MTTMHKRAYDASFGPFRLWDPYVIQRAEAAGETSSTLRKRLSKLILDSYFSKVGRGIEFRAARRSVSEP